MEIKPKDKIKFNILAVICIFIFAFTLSPKTLQNDTFYTIKIGEHITKTKNIDMEDQYAWHDNLSYTYPHWAYDTGIYLIYHAGENIANHFEIDAETGAMTALYVSTIAFSTILGLLIYYTNKKISKNYSLSLLLTLGVLYVLKNFIAVRAQLISYIIFTLEILCIESFLENGHKKYGIFLFILATILANTHVAVWPMFFILAMPYLGEFIIIYLIRSNLSYKLTKVFDSIKLKILEVKIKKQKKEEKLEKLKLVKEKLINKIKLDSEILEKAKIAVGKMEENSYKIKTVKRKYILGLALIIFICAFSGLLAPQKGFQPYTYLVKTMQGNTTQNISEHQPIIVGNSNDFMVVLVFIIILLMFNRTKISYKDLFMLGGLVLMTLMSRRQIALLALIGVYSMAKVIVDWRGDKSCLDDNKIISKSTTLFGGIVIILVTSIFGAKFYGNKGTDLYINPKDYPIEASKYIKENLDIDNIKLYNHYNFGSYLLYKDIPVFIDSRADLYAPEFNEKDIFMDALNIAGINEDYDVKFEEYGITHILTNSDSKLNMLLRKEEIYNVIYEDNYFVIFERNVSK